MEITKKRPRKRGRPSKKPKRSMWYLAGKYIKRSQDVYREGKLVEVNFPSIEGFAFKLNVHRDTLYSWALTDNRVKDAMERIMTEQRVRLINNGLLWRYPTPMVVWLLKANHGFGVRKREKDQRKQDLEIIKAVYDEADRLQAEGRN